MSSEILELAKGTDADYQLGLIDPVTGAALSGQFVGSDTLAAVAWDGGDGATLATFGATWIDASAATIKLSVRASDTTPLEAQPYPVRVTVTKSGRSLVAWEGWIDLSPSPGSTAAKATYGSYADMVQYGGPWLRDLLVSGTSRAGFVDERARARTTLDEWILANYRPARPYGSMGIGYGTSPYLFTSPEGPNPVIKGYLDTNKLIVDDKVREVVARLAIAFACEGKLNPDLERDPYAAQSRYQFNLAILKARGLVARIDTNGDGYAEFTVNLGKVNTRWM